MSDENKSIVKIAVVWIGAITAALSMFFGIQKLYSQWVDARQAEDAVGRLVAEAKVHLQSHNYQLAWAALEQSKQYGTQVEEIALTQENVALQWLRDMYSNEQVGSFADQVDKVTPTLASAVAGSTGQRLADIYSHLGWADFLKWREGNTKLDPELNYRKALNVDPDNVYANTMLAHWMYWNNRRLDEADEYFRRAVETGRNNDYVRQMQFSSLLNHDYTDIKILKFIDAMIRNGEPVNDKYAIHALKTQYVGRGFDGRFMAALRTGEAVESSLSAEEDLALFRRLWQRYPEFVRDYEEARPYIEAILTEAMGDIRQAAAQYQRLQSMYPEGNPTYYDLAELLDKAVTRTGAP